MPQMTAPKTAEQKIRELQTKTRSLELEIEDLQTHTGLKSRVNWPTLGDSYWFVNDKNEVVWARWTNSPVGRARQQGGNIFKTKDEASHSAAVKELQDTVNHLQVERDRAVAIMQRARHYVAWHISTDPEAAGLIDEIARLTGGPEREESKTHKKLVIDAHRWWKNGDHPDDDSPWLTPGFWGEGKVVRYYRHPDDDGMRTCETCEHKMYDHGWIDTAEGGHVVCPGDWVVTGVHGERYPCKPDALKQIEVIDD